MTHPGLAHALLVVAIVLAMVGASCTDRDSARFPHQLHLAGLACGQEGQAECLDCNSCHTVSKQGRTPKLPPGGECTRCHQDDADKVLPVLRAVPERASGDIGFNHDRHLGMPSIEGQCVPCHAGVVTSGASNLPPMSKCLGCHEHQEQWKAGVCAPCHARADLERTLPLSFLRHDAGFARRHGQLAGAEQQLCKSCHSQAQCAECHDVTQDLTIERRQPERIERNLVHRGDFVVRHSIEAQAQPARCVRCHTVESCDACHVARGVSGNRLQGRNPHPPGWVGSNAGSRSFHGQAARRDILSCASCHEQGPATNCIRCHQVGGFGGNPHPGGWKSTQGKGAQMCRYCHG